MWSPPEPVPAAPGAGAGTAPVLFDSAFVTPTHFSPNGDFKQDTVAVFWRVPEETQGLVYVTVQGSVSVVRYLYSPEKPPMAAGTQYRAEWRGDNTEGAIQPDGYYTVHFTGTTTTTQRVLQNQRQVRMDRSPPATQVLEVVPRRFAPNVPRDAEVTPFVRVRVSRAELDDRIGVAILDAKGAPRDTLEPEGGFGGDGDYVFLCKNLVFDDFADGVYQLRAFGLDLAGNDSTAVDSLDKNVLGPKISVSHPPLPRALQRADSLVGKGEDRHGVLAMEAEIVIGQDTTTIALPPRDGAPGATYRFILDVGTLLEAEGNYAILLRGFDADGVADSLQVSVRVDRTPPAPPVPTPPLPQVTKAQLLTGTVRVDSVDTSRIVVTGGVSQPETLFAVGARVRFSRTLAQGTNQIGFKGIDRAGNVSAAHTSTVVWDATAGIVAPERFSAGQSIEVNVGGGTASGVSLRILAMDGSLVRTFVDGAAKDYYRFTWDLQTPEGRGVRNGAYLVLARVRHADGSEVQLRTMIAVVR